LVTPFDCEFAVVPVGSSVAIVIEVEERWEERGKEKGRVRLFRLLNRMSG